MGKTIADLNDVIWTDLPEDKNFEFPIEVFPVQIQSIITDYNRYIHYPIEFTSASILAITSVTIGNTTVLKHLWNTTAVLAFIMVQDRGFKKSHPMRDIFQPLFDKEERWTNEYNIQLEKYRHEIEEYKTAKRLKQEHGEEPKAPISKRITVQRFTPEALVKIHYNNPRGLIVWSDEAKEWFGTFNQYNKGAEEQMWIVFLNGGRFLGDTIKNGNYHLPKTFVSILGGIQPDEFKSFIKENTMNGLVDRICYFYPKYLKKQEWPTEEMPQHSIDQWVNIYDSLYNMFPFNGLENIQTIKYQKEAFEEVRKWQKNLLLLQNKGDKIFEGVAAKAETNIHRLAMILQALHSVCNGKTRISNITVEVAKKAITLQNYFIQEALKVFDLVRNHDTVKLINIWYTLLPDNFNTKQAVDIALKNKLCKERTVFNWLEKDERILKESSNNYKKIVK